MDRRSANPTALIQQGPDYGAFVGVKLRNREGINVFETAKHGRFGCGWQVQGITSFRLDSTTVRKGNARERGEGMADEKNLTREEKIETLKIFAGFSDEQKSLVAIASVLGEHKAKYGAQAVEAAPQPA